jgi:TonB family protein
MSNPHSAVSMAPVLARISGRAFIALGIAAGHIVAGSVWFTNSVQMRAQSTGVAPMYAEFLSDEPPIEAIHRIEPIEIPNSIDMPMPELPEAAVPAINEESAVEVPQIDPLSGPDVARYSARANLPAGKIATVILTVSIGADGAVIAAEVVRSNGDESANAAAIDYARATRWIPGMIGGVPRPMQASLTVILGENA